MKFFYTSLSYPAMNHTMIITMLDQTMNEHARSSDIEYFISILFRMGL